jgi:hypothetical protein
VLDTDADTDTEHQMYPSRPTKRGTVTFMTGSSVCMSSCRHASSPRGPQRGSLPDPGFQTVPRSGSDCACRLSRDAQRVIG